MMQSPFHAIADVWPVPEPVRGKYYKKSWGKPLFSCRVTVDPKEGESTVLKIRLENRKSHSLLAIAPYDGQNGVQSVTDSARHYVLTLHNPALDTWLGIGFRDPSDSIDFSLAIQSFMRRRMSEERLDSPGWSTRLVARYGPKRDTANDKKPTALAPLLSPPLANGSGSSGSSSASSASPSSSAPSSSSSSTSSSGSNSPANSSSDDDEEFGDFHQ